MFYPTPFEPRFIMQDFQNDDIVIGSLLQCDLSILNMRSFTGPGTDHIQHLRQSHFYTVRDVLPSQGQFPKRIRNGPSPHCILVHDVKTACFNRRGHRVAGDRSQWERCSQWRCQPWADQLSPPTGHRSARGFKNRAPFCFSLHHRQILWPLHRRIPPPVPRRYQAVA